MINIIFEPTLFLGGSFVLILIFFYTLRFLKPELTTDWDIFIITLGLVYSIILILHGWRLDPILLFSQVLLLFITISFYWIIIRQRELLQRFLN